MKIVFVVYHDLLSEARSQETLMALENIGDVEVVCLSTLPAWSKSKVHISPYKNQIPMWRYLNFTRLAKKIIKQAKPDIVLLHDAINLIRFVKSFDKTIKIIYDQSELKIDRKSSNLRMFILNCMEFINKRQFRRVDLIFCASEERAVLTHYYYRLRKKPYVFDNIHRIDDEYNEDELNKKYINCFSEQKFTIVYGGGISENRKTYDLIKCVVNMRENVQLIIAGTAPEGLNKFNELTKNSRNIKYVGFVSRGEWRYLLKKADVSFIAFAQNCLNNIYCASGKAYESLFEGTPIISYSNPPLVKLCNDYGIGVSILNEDYAGAISAAQEKIERLSFNASKYALSIDYDNRINKLVEIIKREVE